MKVAVSILAAVALAACGRTSTPIIPVPTSVPTSSAPAAATFTTGWTQPLDRAAGRVIKKRFGTKVSPQDSPVLPERFSGYHTGVDYETFPEEAGVDVPVRAVCSGPLLQTRSASGYGGVAVQSCQLDGEPVTVVYGHVRLSSISAKVGESLAAGDPLGVLGTGGSPETDGERKHLHLGIHLGPNVDVRGYVSTEAGLADWLDPATVL